MDIPFLFGAMLINTIFRIAKFLNYITSVLLNPKLHIFYSFIAKVKITSVLLNFKYPIKLPKYINQKLFLCNTKCIANKSFMWMQKFLKLNFS